MRLSAHPVNWNQLIPTRRSLLSRIKHWDDDRSWREFYEIYHPLIYGAAIKAGLTAPEAEDVVQETVTAVARAVRDLKYRYEPERCRFKTWLHGITKRQVANQFRQRQGKGRLLEPLADPASGESALDDLPDPASRALDTLWDQEYEANLLAGAKKRVQRRVSPEMFSIYDYHVLQQHSVLETARDLSVSTARVYLAKHRVGRLLRQEVAGLRMRLI